MKVPWNFSTPEEAHRRLADAINVNLNASPHTASITITSADSPYSAKDITTIFCDCTGGAIIVDLPTPNMHIGEYNIMKTDAGGNSVTVSTVGSELINGSATATTTTQYAFWRIATDQTNWFIFS